MKPLRGKQKLWNIIASWTQQQQLDSATAKERNKVWNVSSSGVCLCGLVIWLCMRLWERDYGFALDPHVVFRIEFQSKQKSSSGRNFHQKFKVSRTAAKRLILKHFLAQHLHKFWTTSKRHWKSFLVAQSVSTEEEFITKNRFFASLQQFHNEFQMNEPLDVIEAEKTFFKF